MKVQLISDIHVEFDRGKPFQLPEAERDVLVVAGDLGEGTAGLKFLMKELERSPVIYVLGNHEFYQHYWQNIREFWQHKHGKLRVKDHRLYVLDNRAVTLHGVRFIGSTLWSDFDRNSPQTKLAAQFGMSDYSVIGFEDAAEERLLTPEDVYAEHQLSRAYLAGELAEHGPHSVVVTHHAPSLKSIPHGYRDSSVNGCYVSDLEELIETYQPRAWCHGHTHVSQQYSLGETTVHCNPRGYAHYEENPKFNAAYTFDV